MKLADRTHLKSEHEPGRFAIEVEPGARVAPQRRGRTRLADRSPQRGQHRVGLARAGHDDRDDRCPQQCGDRQGVGMGRDVVEPLEAAVVELLITAGRVEPHDLDEDRVEEVGDRRVIERQVAVLADARADDVGRVGPSRSS